VTGYLPHYQKKNRIAAKRERELLHAIRNRYDSQKIALAAERLRDAKIAAFKSKWARKYSAPSHDFSVTSMAKMDRRVAKWLEWSSEEIIEKYARKEAKLCAPPVP